MNKEDLHFFTDVRFKDCGRNFAVAEKYPFSRNCECVSIKVSMSKLKNSTNGWGAAARNDKEGQLIIGIKDS